MELDTLDGTSEASASPRSLLRRRCSSGSRSSSSTHEREVVATLEDKQLGLHLRGDPPNLVEVVGVEVNSWATSVGVEVGNTLVSIAAGEQGAPMEPLDNMDAEHFAALMQKRPLRLRLQSSPFSCREVMAEQGQGRLGVVFHDLPPGYLQVTGIMPDSWAAEVGLHIGDLVSAVNGEDLQRVEAERFKELLQMRPVRLLVEPRMPNYQEFTADVGDTSLGMLFERPPPGHVGVSAVADPGWALSVGVEPGDILVALNDEDLSNLSAESFEALLKERPLKLCFELCSEGSDTAEGFVAGEDVTHLGMTFSADPPGHVDVTEVTEGSWAAQMGIETGDRISLLNGVLVQDMSAEAFSQLLHERPLEVHVQKALWSSEEQADELQTMVGWVMSEAIDMVQSSGLSDYWRQLVETASPGQSSVDLVVVDAVPVSNATDEAAALAELGLVLCREGPEMAKVLEVFPNSWADEQGIEVGDVLTTLNGEAVKDMSPEHFLELLQVRPLPISIQRRRRDSDDIHVEDCFAGLLVVTEEDGFNELGVDVSVTQDGLLEVTAVASPSWAEQVGICAGDFLNVLDAPGFATQTFDSDGTISQLLCCSRPLRLKHLQSSIADELRSQLFDADEICLQAKMEDGQLGITFNSLPPGQLEVGVRPETWAHKAGLRTGDLLTAVNGIDLNDMAETAFMDSLLQRPIALRMVPMPQAPMPVQSSVGNNVEQLQPTALEEERTGEIVVHFHDDLAFDALILEHTTALGFHLSSWPPDEAVISQVDAGSWAEEIGIQVGDVIIRVNGQLVEELSEDTVVKELRSRPLRLAVEQPGGLPLVSRGSFAIKDGAPHACPKQPPAAAAAAAAVAAPPSSGKRVVRRRAPGSPSSKGSSTEKAGGRSRQSPTCERRPPQSPSGDGTPATGNPQEACEAASQKGS